jgi:hypothetical protein
MIKKSTTKKTEGSALLNQNSKIEVINGQDGVHFINVDIKSESFLGKRLSMQYSKSFNTIIGKCISIRMFANAITVPGFPAELLNKFKPSREEIAKIPREGVKVPNYWALIAYAFTEMVKSDQNLKKLLTENTLPITSVEKRVVDFLGTPVPVSGPNYKLGKYVAIIRLVSDMLKQNKFTESDIKDFIVQCKDVPEVDILTGIAWVLPEVKTTEVKQEEPAPEVPEFTPSDTKDDEEDSAETSTESDATCDEAEATSDANPEASE